MLRVALTCLVSATVLVSCSAEPEYVLRLAPPSGEPAGARVLFIAGKDSHGPFAHEHRAGSILLASALQARRPNYAIDVIYGGWPQDEALPQDLSTLVIYCDGGRGHPVNNHLARFSQLIDARVGVVTLHYAVEVPAYSAAAEAMLQATGGYFETHWSVNPHWTAEFSQLPEHPVTRGIEPFSLHDEWYFNMRFRAGMQGVTPLLSAVPPAATMERGDGPHSGNASARAQVAAGKPQVVAWAFERPGGGRGVGYTGGHFHANWENPGALQLVLNAIIWTAGDMP